MILFFSGVFATVGLFAMLGAGYILGKRNTKVKPPEVDEHTQEQIKEHNKQFLAVMNYSPEKAYERKKY